MTASASGPLRGARIVITRPARQAAGLAQQIAALGGKPVMFPAIVILPPAAWPTHLVALAPGPGTATALAAVGVRQVRIPATTMDSEGLLALPELADVAGKRIVIYRGSGGR